MGIILQKKKSQSLINLMLNDEISKKQYSIKKNK
jgi:hypothetical protein